MNELCCMHDMQVQKHLQMRVEAQGKYMQSIVEKAYQALGSSDCATWPAGYRSLGNQAAVLDIGGSTSFSSSLQDLHFYGGSSSHMDQLLQQMERPMDSFLTLGDSFIGSSSADKKGPNHCISSGGKSSMMMWAGEEQQPQPKSGADQLQMEGGIDVMDPITGLYEGAMSGDSMGSKGFEGSSSKLEMKSPPQQAPAAVGSQRVRI